MAHCEVVEPLAFLTTNQQIPGYVTDSDIIAFDQSVMAWSMSNFHVLPEFEKLGFSPLPTPTLVVITANLTVVR